MRSTFIGILLLLLLIPAINISCGKTVGLCPPNQFFSGQSYCLGDKVDALEKDASIVFSTSTGLYHKDQFDNKYFDQIIFYYHGLRKTVKAIVFKYDLAKAEGSIDVDSIAIVLIDILETKFGDSYRILERPSREISDGVKTPELPILMWPIEGGGYITLEYPSSEIYSKFEDNSKHRHLKWMDIYLEFSESLDKDVRKYHQSTQFTRHSLGLE